MLKIILQELKIDHYIKNLVIFIPCIYNSKYLTFNNFIQLVILFISFCLISSTVYIINDLKDKESDCKHPYKKLRPIAQGLISIKHWWSLALSLMCCSFFIAYYQNSQIFILSYLFLNIIYSYFLRKLFFIDVLCIAIGFLIRVTSSFYLLNIYIDKNVICWIFFLSCFFTFTKRRLEAVISKRNSLLLNRSCSYYNEKKLQIFILLSASMSFIFFIKSIIEYKYFYLASGIYNKINILIK